jgi:hypothetical protein
MDALNPDTWKQQWEAFMNAPYIIITPSLIIAVATWWIRGWQVRVYKERLQLASERTAFANEAKDDVIRQFNDLKAEAAKAGNGALAARVANVEAAIEKLSVANNAVRSAIGITNNISAVNSMNVSLSTTPLPLLDEEMTTKAKNGRMK